MASIVLVSVAISGASPPVAMQRAALGALRAGAPFLAAARERYRAARDRARARLKAPAACPPGGAYLWVDFSSWSGEDCMPVLERVAERGVLLAPGVQDDSPLRTSPQYEATLVRTYRGHGTRLAFNARTTWSCCSGLSPGKIGKNMVSCAAACVSGKTRAASAAKNGS